jgi:hypothetical protein
MEGYEIALTAGSHHLIAYLTLDPLGSTPTPCSPFTGLVQGADIPIALGNTENVTWDFPAGIGIRLPANSHLKIEGHYINASPTDIKGQGTIIFHSSPAATHPAYQPAGYVFYGTTKFAIPPNGTFSTGPVFQVAPAGTRLISVTTHQHRLGTGIQAWASGAPGDLSEQIANDLNWAQPAWKQLSPGFPFNGTAGISYQCSWTNTSDQTVRFGESALNEMCFVGGYIYPSGGLALCLDGSCTKPVQN